jgi:transposase-like protein
MSPAKAQGRAPPFVHPGVKAEIVELCQRRDRSAGQVAKDFDLTETAVREWAKQAEWDTRTRSDGGLTSTGQPSALVKGPDHESERSRHIGGMERRICPCWWKGRCRNR